MDHFSTFARLAAEAFQHIKAFQSSTRQGTVFVADIDGDALWARYLAAFPEGTDPVFRKRTEHDCSCCRQFIRRAGGVILLADGKVTTIWDHAATRAPEPYATVAAALQKAVKDAGIRDVFCVGKNETQFGMQKSHSLNKDTQKAETWKHLYTGEIPPAFRVPLPDTERGNYRTTVQVFERGLVELLPEAVDTVLSLINDNSLYRGEEHRGAVVEFRGLQREFRSMGEKARSLFVWENAHRSAARFRNTVIGTLVQDLSENKDLETAVSSFEAKVAPTNYKRTTALITPAMIKKAMQTIETLGLEPALERRFASIKDVSVNDVKWVDGSSRSLMKGGLGDVLMKHAATTSRSTEMDDARVETISIDDFMTRVLPEVQEMEVFFSSAHLGNLMALTAPVHPEPKQLFQWDNDFAWSYGGNVTDSIKERVKKAGGRVDGKLRISLSWFNYDDLDLHVHEPPTRLVHGLSHIYFGNKIGWTKGTLDVDMNAGHGQSREPVENVIWVSSPPDGPYRIEINNYAQRETTDPGFVIEVECGGKVSTFSYNKPVRNGQSITVATLHMKGGAIERIEAGDPAISSSTISKEKWGLTTERYAKVQTVLLSPNYWGDNAIGNKHYFFVLEGCKSDEPMRGIYNEFLHPRLREHRKVFEVIGDKTKCEPTPDQLAGLGFSSTKTDEVRVRVRQGKRQRVFNIYINV